MHWTIPLILLAACIDTGPGPGPKVDTKTARTHMLNAEPSGITRFDLVLGNDYIKYIGNRIDRTRLAPGQQLTITHYWEVLGPTDKKWRPFTLVRGPEGTSDFVNPERSDMQSVHTRWHDLATDPFDKKRLVKKIVEDQQKITIRPDWNSPYASIYVGFIAVGKHGVLDRMNVQGQRTKDRMIVAAELEIDVSRAPPPPGTIYIPRAAGPIVIDGMQLDSGWTNSLVSPEFVPASSTPPGKATARITYDDHNLYLFVSVVDGDVTSPYINNDDPLWKADCISIFIDADGNRRGYVELQVNPRNKKFDAWFHGTRVPSGDVSWDSKIVTEVRVRGTPDPGDSDQGWDVEIAIPWIAVKGKDDQMPVTLPPRVGDRWRLNVNRVDARSGIDEQVVSSWNRVGSDWHGLDRMLDAVFADASASIVPPTTEPSDIAVPPVGSGARSPDSPRNPMPTTDNATPRVRVAPD